MKSRKESHYTL